MKKKPIIVALLVIVGLMGALALYRSSSKLATANLGLECAMMSKRWVVAETRASLASAFPAIAVHTSASGGHSQRGGWYEVLTVDDLYLDELVSDRDLKKIVEKLESSPEFAEWVRNGSQVGQQRKVIFAVVRPMERPLLRVHFLCSNLPDGNFLNEGFKKNMWP